MCWLAPTLKRHSGVSCLVSDLAGRFRFGNKICTKYLTVDHNEGQICYTRFDHTISNRRVDRSFIPLE